MIASILIGLVVAIHCYIVVLIAGLYGGFTASRKILLIQALPAGLALLALWAGV
jgi:putative membrane protein